MPTKHAPAHTREELAQMQSLPLEAKVSLTKCRIKDWYDYNNGAVYLSFSGGKDSTVLKHIIDSMYDDVPAVFVDTGLEYKEIRDFVKRVQNEGCNGLNKNVEIIRPKMRFADVIRAYGYPVVSKRVASFVDTARRSPNSQRARWLRGEDKTKFISPKWAYLTDAPFKVSAKCCDVMKKEPLHAYSRKTGRLPIVGTMAAESMDRTSVWMRSGCNVYDGANPQSKPISFWTEQDVLQYIRVHNVPICSAYGTIVETDVCGKPSLHTTGCSRTGCVYCAFGAQYDPPEKNRFMKLRLSNPRLYDYVIHGGELVDGMWQPSDRGLGFGRVLDAVGVKYEERSEVDKDA